MGSIQFRDDKILFVDGAIAMDPACCERCCPHECDPESPDLASSYTLDADLWAAAEGTDCQQSLDCPGNDEGEFTSTIPPLPPLEQQLDGFGNLLCEWYVQGDATLTFPNDSYSTTYYTGFWRALIRYGSPPGFGCGAPGTCWILYVGPDNVSWDCGLQPPPCVVWYGFKTGGRTPAGVYTPCPGVTMHRPDILSVTVS